MATSGVTCIRFILQVRSLQSRYPQGSRRLEKYLNLEDFLEKSLKIKSALKSALKITQKPWKVLEFYYFL